MLVFYASDVISNVGCLTEEESGRVVFNGEVIEKLVLIAEVCSHWPIA